MKALQIHHRAPGPNTEVYTWTFPGSPIRIELRLDVVARMQSSIANAHHNEEEGQFGGVLLGNFLAPSTVEITDYVLIDADPDCKRTYIADKVKLERLCSGNGSKHAGQIVGYFRTQREPELRLGKDEFETIQRHFNDLRQVVLLISTGFDQATGGFLFWDGGRLNPFSFLEFPFSAELLKYEANQPAEASTPPKPDVVSPSSRSGAMPGVRLTRTLLAAALLVLAAFGAVFTYKMRPRTPITKSSPPAVETPPPTQIVFSAAPLQLQVEGQGDGLNVHWNPQSATVAKAREGRLTIVENGNTRVITLNAQQLTRGHVYYQPSADQVEFTLEVIDDSGASTEEFVLALSSKTNKSVQSIPLARPSADLAANRKERGADHAEQSPPRPFRLPPAQQNSRPAGPTIVQDAPPAAALGSLAPPNALPMDRTPAAQPVAVAPAPAQPGTKAAPNPPPPEIKPPVRVAPLYAPAVARKKTSPVLPASLAARFPPGGRVQVTVLVHIDEQGRVTRAEAESKPQTTAVDRELERMAIDSALRWRFEPAHSGAAAVPSDQSIVFVFERGPGG